MTDKLTFREYEAEDFAGLQQLWAAEAGWGELTEKQFREWYVDIPDGPAILVIGVTEDGRVGAMSTLTPHRVALPDEIIPAARLAATVISAAYQTSAFKLLNHPLPRMLLECRAAAKRRGFRLLFGMPKHNWMSILKIAARIRFEIVPFTHFDCFELDLTHAPAQAAELECSQLGEYTGEHTDLWNGFRARESITCAIHRDVETLNFRNGGHANYEFRDRSGQLQGFAAVRNDGLLFDAVPASYRLFPELILSLAAKLAGGEQQKLKILDAPWVTDTERLGLVRNDYKFGFVSDCLDEDIAPLTAPLQWYVAGGG